MIKINGLNWKNGDGDYYLFGYSNGDGKGKGIRFCYFSSSFGNGSGNGYCFGNRLGDGGSWNPHSLKKEFQK